MTYLELINIIKEFSSFLVDELLFIKEGVLQYYEKAHYFITHTARWTHIGYLALVNYIIFRFSYIYIKYLQKYLGNFSLPPIFGLDPFLEKWICMNIFF